MQANSLGTKTIDEDGFLDLIKNTPGKKSSYELTPDKPTSKKSKKMEVPPPKSSPIPKISPSTSKTTLSQSSVTDSQSSQKSLTSPLTQTPSGSPLVMKGNNEPCYFLYLISLPIKGILFHIFVVFMYYSEESLLWVDKYKPNNIKQIIGQQGDKSNMRKLINWVRNWAKNRSKTHPKSKCK